jgi:hypothetical protein
LESIGSLLPSEQHNVNVRPVVMLSIIRLKRRKTSFVVYLVN